MERPQIVAVIQARMGSSRLPGKVMLDIVGRPMLSHVVRRARLAKVIDRVVVATSDEAADDPIQAFCRSEGVDSYRGDPTDVLDRVYRASRAHHADVVVRITADCPLLDPSLVDQAVLALVNGGDAVDFVANRLPYDRTYPIGLDVETCRIRDLESVWREANEPYQREHVMPFFYENPDRFRVKLLHAEADYGNLRWTVDSPEDLRLIREIYKRFSPRLDFGWREVLDLVHQEPSLLEINANVRHKTERDVG